MTSTTTEICFYDGCTSLATEHDRVGDLACPLHAAQSEKYVVVEDFDGSWLDEASAARAESILVAAGWMVTIRRPRRGEIEATYEVRPGGNLQILGGSIPVPESLDAALREAAEEA